MTSPCPNCSKQSKCGCKSCVKRNGLAAETQIHDEKNDLIICPFCKVASHPDAWLDAEMREIREAEIAQRAKRCFNCEQAAYYLDSDKFNDEANCSMCNEKLDVLLCEM